MNVKVLAVQNAVFGISFFLGLFCIITALWSSQASNDPPGPATTTIYDLSYNPQLPTMDKNRTQIGNERATILMLVRNSELQEALSTMRQIEDRFNKNYKYPWTFLNDDIFTEEVSIVLVGKA
jgi:hypothetical protein